jgi:hypothetical protein
MDLDDIHEVNEYSEMTLRAMIARLRKSRGPEQCIYRETELDEMWRIVDIALRNANSDTADTLNQLRTAIMTAHDLVGMDEKPLEAAAALEAILPVLTQLR